MRWNYKLRQVLSSRDLKAAVLKNLIAGIKLRVLLNIMSSFQLQVEIQYVSDHTSGLTRLWSNLIRRVIIFLGIRSCMLY